MDTTMPMDSHQDVSRRGVGKTAHAIAHLRGIAAEMELLCDPFAKQLGGEIGELALKDWLVDGDGASVVSLGDWVNLIYLRSAKIDERIEWSIATDGLRQVCVLGAGLDTRPWRLGLSQSSTSSKSACFSNLFRETSWIEVDFPEVFAWKKGVLGDVDCLCGNYVAAEADLGRTKSWTEKILSKGFVESAPTLWLLEGLTGYLTEPELVILFDTLSEISSNGSKLLATFLGIRCKLSNSYHRFRSDDPLAFLMKWNWVGTQSNFVTIASEFPNVELREVVGGDYFFVEATLSKPPATCDTSTPK